ncbi:hypothetical protein [Natrinema halophilum]|uniref:hypothetical protein n=1 Tax=Natrinema halophilum TaxID=1699371 RepID=UPI001F2C69E3|nr:hypothetical protein [Natrinema halophilum]UHQ96444.1 hypothetical protein HYG82_23680 [Natrinema halophilum]
MPVIDVTDLMATPAGRDEIGTPDEAIGRCDNCGELYRRREGSWHLCNGERVEYEQETDESVLLPRGEA